MRRRVASAVFAVVIGLAACTGTPDSDAERRTPPEEPRGSEEAMHTDGTPPTTLPEGVVERPDWLGTRPLALRPDGLGQIEPTPPELTDRRFATVDLLPPPETDEFRATVEPVPAEVAARSTWHEACPVGLDDLRYVTLTFWGFDGRPHTGELLANADAVDVMLAGFESLYESRFPIEEMRITRADELDVPPTGDGNNTESFVCRPVTGAASAWSQHAYGRAVDINPFHNPYQKGDIVIPELASAYLDREYHRPGMLTAADVAVFTAAGWGWGGDWTSLKDYQHLSATGR